MPIESTKDRLSKPSSQVMKPISALKYFAWSNFSKPTNDRVAYRAIKKHQFRSIVEIGLTEGVRCKRLIQVAQKYSDAPNVRYTGVDAFDDRDPSETPIKLIEMHRELNGLGAKAQLVPGSFESSLERIANSHLRTDLMIVQRTNVEDAFADAEFARAWRFIPRMLHAGSLVMVFYPNDEYEVFDFLDVESRCKGKLDEVASQTKRAA